MTTRQQKYEEMVAREDRVRAIWEQYGGTIAMARVREQEETRARQQSS